MNARNVTPKSQDGALESAIEELRRQAGWLFATLTNSETSMVVTNPRIPNNPIVFLNQAFSRETGYTWEEVSGYDCGVLLAPNPDQGALRRIEAVARAGREALLALSIRRKDGTSYSSSFFWMPIRNESGEAIFLLATQTGTDQREETGAARPVDHHSRAEAAERLRQTFAAAVAGGAWDWDIPNRRFTADPRFCELCGLDPHEGAKGLSTDLFFAAIHPDDRARIRIAVAGILSGAEVFSKEYRLLAADGSVHWVLARGRCYLGENDEPLRFIGTLVDITEQKHIEQRLRIAQTAGGVGTFEYVRGFGTVSVSEEFCRLLGLHPTHALPVRTINSLVVAGDPLIIGQDFGYQGALSDEFRIVRADTKELRWLVRRGEHVKDAETADTRFIGVVYDITATKRAEQRLRELNERLESRVEERTQERDRLWNLSSDLFSICDAEGYHTAVNPAWKSLLAYEESDIIGVRFDSLVHIEDLSALQECLEAVARGEAVRDFDVRIRSKDNTYHWINWTFAPSSEVFYSIGRDVTQRKQLEDQLRQSQKMEAVGQLTGGIAHDFNNLLTGIVGSLDLMQSRLSQGRIDKLEHYAKAAMASANRAAALTHRLLAFARRQPLDPKPVDPNQLVNSMEELLHRVISEVIQLDLVTPEGVGPILCDKNQLESAILNLAINARDAMPEGGKLTIKTADTNVHSVYAGAEQDKIPEQYVVISVSDTGTGMSPDVVAHAFDPFFTTKPIGEGTGLGLSMVYGFAKQSEGHVRIDSEVGKGTTVSIYLPRFLGELEKEEARAKRNDDHRAESGETVLVVEDEPVVRALIMEVLGDLGYQALEAVDGPSGLRILESKQRIDLLVTDVGLPGLNGRQLADHARLTRSGLKVLFITGYAEEAAVASGFLDAGMEIIPKPFKVEDLAVRIRDMIQRVS